MTAPTRELLEAAADHACEAAQRQGRTHWLAWSQPDPSDVDPLERLAGSTEARFAYAVPAAGEAWAGLGQAAGVRAGGEERFASARDQMAEISARLVVANPDRGRPLWVGGFAFADATGCEGWESFGPAQWWLPSRLWSLQDDTRTCTITRAVEPGDDPARVAEDVAERMREAWQPPAAPPARRDAQSLQLETPRGGAEHRGLIGEALATIARGELEKVVVARALDVERDTPIDTVALTRGLREQHPSCACFWVGLGDADFVGATPERLLRRTSARIDGMALAGSAARGRDPEEDARLRRSLVESKKEQAEHAVAVRELRDALEACGAHVESPDTPRVMELGGVRHLHTPLRGSFRGDPIPLFDVARRAHPTAAVAGAPRLASQSWLARHEPLDRGWYAGLVGWVTPDGDGELSAALRCALICGNQARVFAGGGIVAGSDPEAELRETRLKWNALLPALLEL